MVKILLFKLVWIGLDFNKIHYTFNSWLYFSLILLFSVSKIEKFSWCTNHLGILQAKI